jgi:acyl-CoA synthetase (AMP-forming)/AMP-acid ligase II
VQLPNWREYVALVVGVEAAGAVFGFCPATWGARETARALDLIQPRLWFIGAGREAFRDQFVAQCFSEAKARPRAVGVRLSSSDAVTGFGEWLGADTALEPSAGGRGNDPVEVAVTSGTTGAPKGVVHVHDSALATVQSTIVRQEIGPEDTILLGIPVGHTFGYFYGVRCALQSGARLVLQERWDVEEAVELIERWQATVSLGPAACVIDLLALPESDRTRLASMRLFTQSGDALPRPVAERAAAHLPFRISRALGMTEFGHVASTDAHSDPERVFDSAGSPQPGIAIEIRDSAGQPLPAGETGRVFVSGPFLFSGYLHPDRLDTNVLDASGFFETGDLGWLGPDGYLHITGREKNVIRRGATTIPTSAVEDAIAAHPDIAHAVVIARPDERLAEVPIACVQMLAGRKPLDLEALKTHLASLGMTRTFWPEGVLLVDEWPVGATAKIDRRALLDAVMAQGL